MRFALVNNERVEASPELNGLCPGCGQAVIAKCGTQRIWHWAHRGKRTCDPWWETETEWHRNWKNKFPSEWQEYRQRDQSSGEWHIADVRTSHGLVIEFQHSHINPQERALREHFYRNMVWVVDGTRLKRDFPRFEKGMNSFKSINEGIPFLMPFPEECFPTSWLESRVPIVFDFQSISTAAPDKMRELLWWLFPGRVGGSAVVQAMSRQDFLKITSSHPNLLQEAHRVVNDYKMRGQQQTRTVRIDGDILRLLNQQLMRRSQWRRSRRSRRF